MGKEPQERKRHGSPSSLGSSCDVDVLVSASPPRSLFSLKGQTFIPPNSSFARAVIKGSSGSKKDSPTRCASSARQQASNLTMLLNKQRIPVLTTTTNSVSPSPPPPPPTGTSAGGTPFLNNPYKGNSPRSSNSLLPKDGIVRRCMSSKELGTLAPASGSPYVSLLHKMGEIESSMNQRFMKLKHVGPGLDVRSQDGSCCTMDDSIGKKKCSNELRNQRRAEHAKAVVEDLCDIVAELFLAEAKLLDPSIYGVSRKAVECQEIKTSVHDFISTLPLRYALGVESPSEVLLHMRLMAAVRSNPSKVALHIHKTDDDATSRVTGNRHSSCNTKNIRLVTLSCLDVTGLLEFLSNLLATGGSRVLDADIIISSEGVVLDRFVVEMTGRLRLDKMSKMIEAFLTEKLSESQDNTAAGQPMTEIGGPIYYKHASPSSHITLKDLERGVPLTAMLASASHANLSTLSLPVLRKRLSATPPDPTHNNYVNLPNVNLPMKKQLSKASIGLSSLQQGDDASVGEDVIDFSKRLPMMIPDPSPITDVVELKQPSVDLGSSLDFLNVPGLKELGGGDGEKSRAVPLIPFEELMLIETIGTGRISTIYRAAWQRAGQPEEVTQEMIRMVALKVAMMNQTNNDSSNVDELRREADVAARLSHPCVSNLVGVAADAECFCLAYDYCEGGSLLSLLNDHNRNYEYLSIALDISNGMAYLHSRNIIHRDLKPANVLLTRDHRAKISDFGMSIKNQGQELTSETGTYRYMAPEVIRHEPYSSNADVYSFGICLWQLITREIPFKTMTPVQAAYAVAGGRRPEIPPSTPPRLREIIESCWDQNSNKRPTFTYIAMALADYARFAFSPANVGAQTLQIANDMLATVEGNSTVNVDFTAPVDISIPCHDNSYNIGLEIE